MCVCVFMSQCYPTNFFSIFSDLNPNLSELQQTHAPKISNCGLYKVCYECDTIKTENRGISQHFSCFWHS